MASDATIKSCCGAGNTSPQTRNSKSHKSKSAAQSGSERTQSGASNTELHEEHTPSNMENGKKGLRLGQ